MRPSRKHTLQDLNFGDGYFLKFDDWIVDAITDAQKEGRYITIAEIELSRPPNISSTYFRWDVGLW